MRQLPYGLSVHLSMPYQEAVAATRDALKAEGFGVLTEIDVKRTMKEKLGADFQPYVILGACNPSLAHRALIDDPEVGLLLPCNVTVRQDGGGSIVSALDPSVMSRLSESAGLREVAVAARERLERVLQGLERLAPAN